MVRTVISIDPDDKAWLDRQAKREGVPMTRIVQRAIAHLRKEAEADPGGLDDALARRPTQLLDAFITLPIDRRIADPAAALCGKYGWKLPEAFQAALAQNHSLRFVTRNEKDFPPRRHAFVLVPYRV